jgi:outer membrane protein
MKLSVTIAAAVTLFPAVALGQAARRLTMTDAIKLGVERSLEPQAAAQGALAARARVKGAGAQRFPVLRAEGNILYWDRPLDVAFVMPGMMPGASVPALRVRDQVTSQATVTLAQPISALLAISRLIGMEQKGLEASQADVSKSRLDSAQRAAESYLRVLQARALETIASKSMEQVEAQLARAKVLEKGGVLGPVDVLRLTSARESLRAQQLRARQGVAVAIASLVLVLDLPVETSIETVDDLPDPPPPMTWREQDVARQATERRPEVKAARDRTEQAWLGRSVAKSQLLPNIMAVATYQHTEGQATFQPKNAWFLGATLSWDVFDWGKNWQGVKEAEARANQAAIGTRAVERQVVFEAGRLLGEARTAFETVGAARAALQAAEEAHRIQSVRYKEGAANTTDVLDAETDVLRARIGYAQARYDYYLAQAGLARAVGRLPSTQIGGIDADR